MGVLKKSARRASPEMRLKSSSLQRVGERLEARILYLTTCSPEVSGALSSGCIDKQDLPEAITPELLINFHLTSLSKREGCVLPNQFLSEPTC